MKPFCWIKYLNAYLYLFNAYKNASVVIIQVIILVPTFIFINNFEEILTPLFYFVNNITRIYRPFLLIFYIKLIILIKKWLSCNIAYYNPVIVSQVIDKKYNIISRQKNSDKINK